MGAGNSYLGNSADWEFSAGSALRPHQQLLSFLLALSVPDPEIMALLPGLLPQLLGMLRMNKVVIQRVKEINEKHLGKAAEEQLEMLIPGITEVMKGVISDKSGTVTLREKLEASKWVWEQIKGKARQKGEGEDEASLAQFMKLAESLIVERENKPQSYAAEFKKRTKGDGPDEWIRTLRPKETR